MALLSWFLGGHCDLHFGPRIASGSLASKAPHAVGSSSCSHG
jgi:hypothetical protein